ncbi:MAG: class I SAM-dependent methyltransferase [Candidatus Woesebacteria bacterium]|nr:MAG: class I SAM-dependent methyltransferase [Candidatus Woesebacteria bacterium]
MDIDYSGYHRDFEYIENERLFRNIFMKRFNMLWPHFTNVSRGKVLDVGCSNGVFLDIFKERGWQTFGVEPSKSGTEAKRKGHKVTQIYFEKSHFPDSYFDLVIMNHTLEHVNDAGLVLKMIHNILKKDGLLYVDVPNAGGLGSKIMRDAWPLRLPKEHNYQFTKSSLSKKIKDAGFKITRFESRSGLFEFASPLSELWQSFSTFKRRFFVNLLLLPYSFLATSLNMGDSMSIIAKNK